MTSLRSFVSSPRTRSALAVAFLFTLLYLRKPDALDHPQFFAEDGRVFFHDQVLLGGAEAVFTPVAGYLLVIPRLVAAAASFGRIADAPFVYNFAALALAAVCCAAFSFPGFRTVVRSDALRFAVCVIAAAGLDSAELLGTITNVQWFLQLGGILLLVYAGTRETQPSAGAAIGWSIAMLLTGLSVPLLTVAVPIALWFLWRAAGRWKWVPAALLAAVGTQVLTYAAAGITRGQSGLFQFHGLIESTAAYLAFRGVLSGLVGRPEAMEMAARGTLAATLAVIAGTLVVLGLLWWKSPRSIRWWIVGALYFAAASAMLSIGARDLPRASQAITFGGERYFYLAACCVVLLAAIAVDRIAIRVPGSIKALALLAIFGAGLRANFAVTPFVPLTWEHHARLTEQWMDSLRAGVPLRPLTIPINPAGWYFTLDGTVLTNGSFEAGHHPWLPVGLVHLAETAGAQSDGYQSLVTAGGPGFVRQLVLGFEPGMQLEAQAMVVVPCEASPRAALFVDDGRSTNLLTVAADPSQCGRWQKLEGTLRVGRSRRVLVRLDYGGGGAHVYWDDIRLEPVVDAVFASWGGFGTLPGGAGGSPRRSSGDWLEPGQDTPAGFRIVARPNTSPAPRVATVTVGTASRTVLQLAPPVSSEATSVQLAVFRPGEPETRAFAPAQIHTVIDVRGSFGAAGDQPFMADWTGSGVPRLGVFRAGRWLLDLNGNGRWDGAAGGDGEHEFGLPGDVAVVGDWSGSGVGRVGVLRCPPASECTWVLDTNGNLRFDPDDAVARFGIHGDTPVVARWKQGTIADQIGVFRAGSWIVDNNGSRAFEPSDETWSFGLAGDVPVVSRSRSRVGVFRGDRWLLDLDGDRRFDRTDAVIVAGRKADRTITGEW